MDCSQKDTGFAVLTVEVGSTGCYQCGVPRQNAGWSFYRRFLPLEKGTTASHRIILDSSLCRVVLSCLLHCTMTLLVLPNIAGQVEFRSTQDHTGLVKSRVQITHAGL